MGVQYILIHTESYDNDTALPLVGVLVTWYERIFILSIISIKNEKLSNSKILGANLSFLGSVAITSVQICTIFAENDPFKPTILYKILHI